MDTGVSTSSWKGPGQEDGGCRVFSESFIMQTWPGHSVTLLQLLDRFRMAPFSASGLEDLIGARSPVNYRGLEYKMPKERKG